MINELYELSKVLHNEDIKTQSWHRKYQPIPNIRSNAPCVCIKVSAGKVIGISSVDAELGKILRKYGSNQGSYPCMNLAPLYRITDDTKKKKIADLGNHPEKIDDACIAEMRAWCTENTYNWSKKFQGKYKISMEKTPMELHCIATQYEPLKILLDETNFFATASGLHKELERTAWELLERKDQTSLALSVLFYQGKKGKGSVIMERLICVLVGYVFGLIQTGYIYGKKNGVDLRKKGSGNAGTTNALRTMGWKAGAVTLLGDCFKCVAAVVVVHLIYGKTHTDMMPLLSMYAGMGAVLGHNYPF